ncbi:short chain dehydrogenase [Penicillium herquei]|nr:short chain dehydrogenase [Penicillium herquei]
MFRLDGKVALVTGLGQTSEDGWGIGAAIAMKLAQQGASIFGGNRTLAAAETTKARIEAEGGICHVQQTDVTDSASVEALVNACFERHGRIDILINNVGKSEPGCPATMLEDIWDQQVDLNLKSVYLTTHFVLPIMEKQETGGAVINVSSIAGLRYIGKPQVAYSATKAAIMQFTKATAVIYADRRMRDDQVPMKRMGDAWDVANATLFLAADESRYITGQELIVDGGITSSTGRV